MRSYWNCICECGKEKILSGKDVKSGNTKSCGCLEREKKIERIIAWSKLPYNLKNLQGRKRSDGYNFIRIPEHPLASAEGYVAEHRLVLEKKIGRYLKPKEVAHHWDTETKSNDPDKLGLFRNQGSHAIFHQFAKRHKIKMVELKFKQPWLSEETICS